MNVAELKKRLLRGFAYPELFYLPVKKVKEIKKGTLYICTRIPYYNVDTETFDDTWKTYQYWYTQIVVKDISDNVVYTTRKNTTAQLHTINNLPYGTYKVKVIMAAYGGVVLDELWHEYVLNDSTNRVYQFVDLYYNVYKCVMYPDREECDIKSVQTVSEDDLKIDGTKRAIRASSPPRLLSAYSYALYENGNIVQSFKRIPPFEITPYETFKIDSFCAGYITFGCGRIASYYTEYDVSANFLNQPYDFHVNAQIQLRNDEISGYDTADVYETAYDNNGADMGGVYTSIKTNSTISGSAFVPCFTGNINETSGYMPYIADTGMQSLAIQRDLHYGGSCSSYTKTSEGYGNYSNNDIRPAVWLQYYCRLSDTIKKTETELDENDKSALLYTGFSLYLTVYKGPGIGGMADPVPRIMILPNGDKPSRDGYTSIETVYNPQIPDFSNTLYYQNVLKAEKRGANKNNYYGYSGFYWIHNGQYYYLNSGQCNIIRNSDDVLQTYSTVEQYATAGPAVYSDDYDDYY